MPMKHYVKLLRVPHYIKNLLVFIPLVFAMQFHNLQNLKITAIGFAIFCLVASIVYIINDLKDMENDKLHPVKKFRPLASGTVSKKQAASIMIFLILAASILCIIFIPIIPFFLLILYITFNIAYSFGLKNIQLLDVCILASGYILRIYFGALLIEVEVSVWLYLTVTAGAFYMAFGKRGKNMVLCQTLAIVFYSLWSIDTITVERIGSNVFAYTVPIIIIIFLRYSMLLEKTNESDPMSIVFKDKALVGLCILYCIIAGVILW
jgi:4-hydroxybenzoate polyprenyltransferase